MYAMVVAELVGPEGLARVELEDPTPGPGEVVVEVRAAACNFADVLITQGKYQVRPSLPFAPGSEVAGVVSAVGEGVTRVRVGQRVSALLTHGGYASHVLAPEIRVFPVPDAMGFAEAASLGVVYLTSWLALCRRTELAAGETLLVHAAAGGVGLSAVQLGAALGATVIGTAGGEEKLALVRAHGAHHAIDSRDPAWVERVKELTGGRGADVIYDPVGGDTFQGSTKCIAWEGRLLVIGFASGDIPDLRMNRVMLKNISVVGVHFGAYFEHDPEQLRRGMAALHALYAEGRIAPLVSESRPLVEAPAVLADLAARRTTGKVVLCP